MKCNHKSIRVYRLVGHVGELRGGVVYFNSREVDSEEVDEVVCIDCDKHFINREDAADAATPEPQEDVKAVVGAFIKLAERTGIVDSDPPEYIKILKVYKGMETPTPAGVAQIGTPNDCSGCALKKSDEARRRNPWGIDPKHHLSDWQEEVANGDTRLGYWEWVQHREEEA